MPTLVFVYNADSSIFARTLDFAHKIVSSDTYDCNLCAITYGNTGMKRKWKDFTKSLPHEVTFLHRDEFLKQYPDKSKMQLPALLLKSESELEVLISAGEMNAFADLDQLIENVGSTVIDINA